jgi:hypothetical protein
MRAKDRADLRTVVVGMVQRLGDEDGPRPPDAIREDGGAALDVRIFRHGF